MRVVLVAGTTQTAEIEGISAAGSDPAVMVHTPSADAELLEYGRPVRAPVVPVSPTGCPTPAVVTRAVREVLDFETTVLDAGLARPTAAPTVALPTDAPSSARPTDESQTSPTPGADVREPEPVPNAREAFESAREFGASLPDDELVVGETIPGGTTTALGVLSALGERRAVSSSLPDNPLALKRDVVAEALSASDLSEGDLHGKPVAAVRQMGDPVLAVVAGLTCGALESGTDVTLAGGTQLATAGALVRHAGIAAPLELATTSFVAEDETAEIRALAEDFDLSLTVTDPGFDACDHPAMAAYCAGEAKEGVGMGGALALAKRAGTPDASADALADVREQIQVVYDRITASSDADDAEPATEPDDVTANRRADR